MSSAAKAFKCRRYRVMDCNTFFKTFVHLVNLLICIIMLFLLVALLVFVLNPQCMDLHNMKSHISLNVYLAFKQVKIVVLASFCVWNDETCNEKQ